MAQEQNSFSIDDVLDRLSQKLIDRHPHVFGDVKAETSSEVLRNWEALKTEERKKKQPEPENPKSLLAGVSRSMPTLLEAHKLSAKASKVGFDWPKGGGLLDKLRGGKEELRQQQAEKTSPRRSARQHGKAR